MLVARTRSPSKPLSLFSQKQRLNSFLNIIGLAVGIACSLLIIFHVKHELSYDRYFSKADRIYRLIDADSPATKGWACTSPVVGLLINDDIPEIEQVHGFFTCPASFFVK